MALVLDLVVALSMFKNMLNVLKKDLNKEYWLLIMISIALFALKGLKISEIFLKKVFNILN